MDVLLWDINFKLAAVNNKDLVGLGLLMAVNQLICGDNRSFEDIFKLVFDILKYENVFMVGLVQPLQFGKPLDKKPN